MRILIVAATRPEINELITTLPFTIHDHTTGLPNPEPGTSPHTTHNSQLTTQFTALITGAGMVPTAFALGQHLAANRYDLAINLGIAGSFDREIALGDIVNITEDTLAELGAEDDEEFIPIAQLGFGEGTFNATYTLPANAGIAQATAITVNTVHGNEASIQKLSSRITAQIESMEGAAFFYACRQMGVPCMQIRAVSNYVEKRNREAWKIGLAIKNLNTFAVEYLKSV
ncbi:hypothetical protein GCM10023149_42270 [Mucilaginibacter gynuensis]|uniref:Futalosine hydrolase n=1 Tax=Mucilaginibacter gynuensis TaxID=1302236 RepID=A0ABP8H5L7_9SPHI